MLVAHAVINEPDAVRPGRLLICRGLPASGKSTFAEKWVAENPHRRSRVNRDSIRMAYFNSFWHESIDELAVAEMSMSILTRLIEAGRDVINDDTNLHPDRLRRLVEVGKAAGYRIEAFDFDAPIDELVARDAARERSVGAAVIVHLRDQLYPGGEFPPLDAPIAVGSEALPRG